MSKVLHQPLGGNKTPRFGGPATMMRLPMLPSAAPRCLLRRRTARHRHLEPRRCPLRPAPGSGRFCCRSRLPLSLNSDSVVLMRISGGAVDNGAT
jgi:hypothetical protein